jgi:hypothetical protein
MTNVWNKPDIEKRIRDSLSKLSKDGKPVQSTSLFDDLLDTYGQSYSTTTKYLEIMQEKGDVEKIEKRHKDKSYVLREDKRLTRLINDFTNEIEKSLSSYPKDTAVSIDVIAHKFSKYIANRRNEAETKEGLEELRNDYYLMEETLFYTLISRLFRILKTIAPIEIAKKEDFYVDSLGNVVPKKLVDQRIKASEITEWTEHEAFIPDAVKIIRESVREADENFAKNKKKNSG